MLATKQYLDLELELDLGNDTFINMEFLRSFLRRHFAGKSVVASPNVGCFLRQEQLWPSAKQDSLSEIVSSSYFCYYISS